MDVAGELRGAGGVSSRGCRGHGSIDGTIKIEFDYKFAMLLNHVRVIDQYCSGFDKNGAIGTQSGRCYFYCTWMWFGAIYGDVLIWSLCKKKLDGS